MALRVLIVSPDAGFGGLIQQTLDNSGEYEPVLVVNGRQALELASKLPFDLAILDADMTGFNLVELGMALQELSPNVCLILIPGSSPSENLTQAGLRICGYLTKPFYLPDLLDVVGKASQVNQDGLHSEALPVSQPTAKTAPAAEIQVASKGFPPPVEEVPAWVGNPDRAAQHLARLSMESASQAALILKTGRLWAYAGHLSREAGHEIAVTIQQDWQRQSSRSSAENKASDLVRFVRLKSTGEDTMLYATSLGEDLVLVLAFDVRTPISKIHNQAGVLARALATSNGLDSTQEAPVQPPVIPLPLGDIPPPTPPEYKGEIPKVEGMQWPWELDPELDDQSLGGDEEPPRRTRAVTGSTGAAAQTVLPAAETRVEGEHGDAFWSSDEAEVTPYPSPEELPPVSKVILSSPVVYVIHFACVLLPRMPEHQLRGDLPTLLSRWMRRISLVSGWRLEYIAVHPDYLHWIAGVAPEVSAVDVIHLVRQQTSAWIFADCPAYARDNPSTDFWAPGFLVLTGSRPLPTQLVNEYIKQTRTRQGVAGEN